MRLLTIDDFLETYIRLRQRGFNFILSKFKFNSSERTVSSFDSDIKNAHWYIIPDLINHQNSIISGNPDISYEDYVVEKYLKNRTNLSMISIGCGEGNHELKFAAHNNFEKIIGVDLSENRIKAAQNKADSLGLKNINFISGNGNHEEFYSSINAQFDVILFDNSLHHLKNVADLLGNQISKLLKDDGILIIKEYIGSNRLQWSSSQLKFVNNLLIEIPLELRKIFQTNMFKKKVYGPGIIRMIISDPSEAVDSNSILPSLHKYFIVEEEKYLGGNIYLPLFKDIAHNFIKTNSIKRDIFVKIFEEEKKLLEIEKSLLLFGVYRKCIKN